MFNGDSASQKFHELFGGEWSQPSSELRHQLSESLGMTGSLTGRRPFQHGARSHVQCKAGRAGNQKVDKVSMADHRKHGASREGTYRLNARRGYLASAFQWRVASVSGELGKQVEKGRIHSFPIIAASQERPFVAALLQTAGLEGANMDVLRAPGFSSQAAALCEMLLAPSCCYGPAVGPWKCLAWRSRPRCCCSPAWVCGVGLGQMNWSGNLNRQIPLNEAQSSTTGPRPPPAVPSSSVSRSHPSTVNTNT